MSKARDLANADTAINLGENEDRVGIGFTYIGNTFQAPPQPEVETNPLA